MRIRQRRQGGSSFFAHGEPMLWTTGGALAVCTAMVAGLLLLVFWHGLRTFWPQAVFRVETPGGPYMGEITRHERYVPEGGEREIGRRLVRTGNFRITQTHFHWVSDDDFLSEDAPEWALVVERLEWGRFYGLLEGFDYLAEDGSVERHVEGAAAAWEAYLEEHGPVHERWEKRRRLEEDDTGEVNRVQEEARLRLRQAELDLEAVEERYGEGSQEAQAAGSLVEAARGAFEEKRAWANEEFSRIRSEIDAINAKNDRYRLVLRTAGEGSIAAQTVSLALANVVRAYPANRVGFFGKLGVYLGRWVEFLTGEPREANSEGGVFPAIFGTVVMTLAMSLAVVPFGVMAALYLREYARGGFLVSAVRVAVNNLAGVPSIVFGVFGLGFFCYTVGAKIDELFFAARLPNPTFGTGGLLWASLTLALLTLPVVIVATEEAISAVPSSMREGSYACGASKWQTIRRIVLPRALPGIITGMILAIARGAGEVAPLMLVGAVKLAPELPLDGTFPFLHPERSFMHLGFHIYDVGFQSQNSEAAKPMVYTTTLLLIGIVAVLNLAAVYLRGRLRRRFAGGQF